MSQCLNNNPVNEQTLQIVIKKTRRPDLRAALCDKGCDVSEVRLSWNLEANYILLRLFHPKEPFMAYEMELNNVNMIIYKFIVYNFHSKYVN
jgi:hypothetical protein